MFALSSAGNPSLLYVAAALAGFFLRFSLEKPKGAGDWLGGLGFSLAAPFLGLLVAGIITETGPAMARAIVNNELVRAGGITVSVGFGRVLWAIVRNVFEATRRKLKDADAWAFVDYWRRKP